MNSDDKPVNIEDSASESAIAVPTFTDGGPAFPTPVAGCNDGVYPASSVVQGGEGMSLRDWFAGQALAGMLSNKGSSATLYALSIITYRPLDFPPPWNCAKMAYALADAMLAARK